MKETLNAESMNIETANAEENKMEADDDGIPTIVGRVLGKKHKQTDFGLACQSLAPLPKPEQAHNVHTEEPTISRSPSCISLPSTSTVFFPRIVSLQFLIRGWIQCRRPFHLQTRQ